MLEEKIKRELEKFRKEFPMLAGFAPEQFLSSSLRKIAEESVEDTLIKIEKWVEDNYHVDVLKNWPSDEPEKIIFCDIFHDLISSLRIPREKS